jgi:hypothetical protein
VYKETEAARRDLTAAQAEHLDVVYEEEEVGALSTPRRFWDSGPGIAA